MSENKCIITSHTVPYHFHPMYSLHWILREYRDGLSGGALGIFFDLTVRKLLERSPADSDGFGFVADMPEDKNALLQAVAAK